MRTQRPFDNATVLHEEGSWLLKSTEKSNDKWMSRQGWLSVIEHDCPHTQGSPYWMLIEYANDESICLYCNEHMPDTIACLFKLMNWEKIK